MIPNVSFDALVRAATSIQRLSRAQRVEVLVVLLAETGLEEVFKRANLFPQQRESLRIAIERAITNYLQKG